jgi:hypothetical protein
MHNAIVAEAGSLAVSGSDPAASIAVPAVPCEASPEVDVGERMPISTVWRRLRKRGYLDAPIARGSNADVYYDR